LEALAFYTLTLQHYAKAREFERGLAKAIGSSEEFDDTFGDAIYGTNGPWPDFDEVLAGAGIKVSKPPKRKNRK
jgi:hypothetical protein